MPGQLLPSDLAPGTPSPSPGPASAIAPRLCLLGAAFLWSFGGLFIKTLIGRYGVAPEGLACLRSLAAGLVLAWALPRISGRRTEQVRAHWPRVAGACAAYAVIVGTFVMANARTSAANAIFLQYAYPLLVAAGAPLFYSERIGRRTALALALGMAGVATIVAGSWNPQHAHGIGFGLLSATAFAAFTLVQRGIRADAVGLASLYNLIAAALLLPFALGKFTASPQALLLVAAMGVVQLGLPYVLFIRGLQRVPAAEAALITLIEPVLNPIWVWLIVGEMPTTWTVIGGAVILLALTMRFLGLRRRTQRLTNGAFSE